MWMLFGPPLVLTYGLDNGVTAADLQDVLARVGFDAPSPDRVGRGNQLLRAAAVPKSKQRNERKGN